MTVKQHPFHVKFVTQCQESTSNWTQSELLHCGIDRDKLIVLLTFALCPLQSMVSLIACMSVSLKLEIIRGESGGATADHWLLQMANSKNLTLAEVAAVCLQEDLYTEILGEGMVSKRKKNNEKKRRK